MILEVIKHREKFILNKNSKKIETNSRIVNALNSSSMLSSKNFLFKSNLAQRERSHLLLRDKEEEKTMKGLKKEILSQREKNSEVIDENESLKKEIEKLEN